MARLRKLPRVQCPIDEDDQLLSSWGDEPHDMQRALGSMRVAACYCCDAELDPSEQRFECACLPKRAPVTLCVSCGEKRKVSARPSRRVRGRVQ